MKVKTKPNWGAIGGGLLILFWIVVCILAAVRHFQEKSAGASFEEMNEKAQSVCGICFSQVSEYPIHSWLYDEYQGPTPPFLNGKVLVVEANTGEAISSTMIDMASDIAAANPEEVRILVCAVEVEEVKHSTYSDNQPGYFLIRDFCFYDLLTDSVIFAVRIYGGPPPAVKQGSGPEYGPDPAHMTLIQLLEGLPRK